MEVVWSLLKNGFSTCYQWAIAGLPGETVPFRFFFLSMASLSADIKCKCHLTGSVIQLSENKSSCLFFI